MKNTSPNIDAGDPTFEPPELGGDIIDIGALELLYEEPVYNPEIKINPEKFDISILPDVSKDTTLVISNTGEDTLLFRIRDDAVWLTETPTSGNILEGYSKNIKVSIKGAGLLIGNYTGKMTILSNDPENDTLRVPVNLTVLPYVDLKLETAQTWVPRGGTLDYSQILTNLTTKTQNFIQWFTVNKQGGPVVWKSSTKNYSLTSGQVKGENFKQAVPVTAPLGFYVFNSYIGSSESYVWDTDSFAFEIRIGGQDSGR